MTKNMKKIKGYLVKYSNGSYEDYFEFDVAVFDNREEAEKERERVDKNHKEPPKCKISDENWEKIMFEYDEWFDDDKYENSEIQKKYPNLLGRDCYDYEDWQKDHEQTIKEQEMLHEDIVMKYYPDFDREEARYEINQIELKERLEMQEYGDAWIEEIDMFIS